MLTQATGAVPAFTDYYCSICHSPECLDNYEADLPIVSQMEEQHICFQCAYWLEKIHNPEPNRIIANGFYYLFHPYVKRPLNKIKGSLGKEFYFYTFDRQFIKSNDVWCQGKIPEHFKEQLPDNAYKLSLQTYMRLKQDPFVCQAKGCWNRYYCIRYNKSCEADGPFNEIPKGYVIGSDGCPSFINKDNL